MRASAQSLWITLAALGAASALGCSSSGSGDAGTQPATTAATTAVTAAVTASATATATATASTSAAAADGPPVCQRSGEKVWGAGANKLTGLTTKGFDNKVAVGFAFGNDPRVLVVAKDGSAKLMKVKQGEKAKRPDPKEGTRFLMRVSPSDVSGDEARAFIDYRDEFKKDKRRHVWCGPADADDKFLEYNGTSWLDMDPKPTGDDKKKFFSWKKLGGYVELRDCRTFVSRKDQEVWALGSVLRGIEKPDGTNEWKMVFLVDFGKNDDEIVLHEAPLKGDPPKATAFEIPISRRIKDKGWLIATRFGGSLLVGLLDKDRKLQGSFKSYPGFPTMPDIATTDEDNLVLTTGLGVGKERGLRALTISKDNPELPKGYTTIKLDPVGDHEGEASFSAPELTHDDKGRRWLVYTEGPRDKPLLRLTPLGIDMQPNGRTFAITEGEAYASEARLISLSGGKLLVVYLRDKEGKTELVSEHLDCEIKK
ncbi:MAG: hypothetical protein IPK82_22215 [Polyangiaceae bacterium]|nr:hypothetical protein [Polyangiaceae bacterium]